MLLSFRNVLTISLRPDGLQASFCKAGWRPVAQTLEISQQPVATSIVTTAPSWEPAILALDQWLSSSKWKRTSVRLIISDRFVRYACLPWSSELRRENELGLYALAHFENAFGSTALQSTICYDKSRYGSAMLACAMPDDLIYRLRVVCQAHGLSLSSLTPSYVATFNRWRTRLNSTALFVSVEKEHCVMGHISNGQWHGVRSSRLPQTDASTLIAVIERELILQGVQSDTPVYVDLHGVVDGSLFSSMERYHQVGRGLGNIESVSSGTPNLMPAP